MKMFWHYNESDTQSASLLLPLMLFSEEVSLWSPSYHVSKSAKDQGVTKLGPFEIIELVEAGHIKIAGREDWLVNGTSRKNSQWHGAQWHEEFDEKILRIFEDDYNKPTKRVTSLPVESGYEQADHEIGMKSKKYKRAMAYVRQKKLPLGTKQRIQTKANSSGAWMRNPKKMAARELLRDAFNYENSRQALGADVSFEHESFSSKCLAEVAGRSLHTTDDLHPDFTIEKLNNAMDFALSLANKETVNDIIEVRQNQKEMGNLWQLVISEQGARRKLLSQLKDGNSTSTLAQDLIGNKITDRICQTIGGTVAISSAVVTAYQMKCTRRQVGMAILGLSTAVGPGINNLSERISLTSEGDYSGPFWPFAMSLGVRDPTQAQLIALTEQLLRRKIY
jgi:hypothetical protein